MTSLDEIRKRFGKNGVNSNDEGANHFGFVASSGGSSGANSKSVSSSAGLTEATLKIFDQLKKFEVQISEIANAAEPLTKVLNQTARTLDEIRVFHSEMEGLSRAYDGIRTFQAALNSDGARELRDQFDAIEKIFYENLSSVAALLEPALEFQTRISELAKIFDGLTPLQEKFMKLAGDFKPQAAQPTRNTIVLDQSAVSESTAAPTTSLNAAVPGNGH